MKFVLLLSPFQVDILLETVEAFVDNQKLLHIPNKEGEIVALPLTRDALLFIKDNIGEEKTEIEVEVEEGSGKLVMVKVLVAGAPFTYQVDLNDFDES